MFCGKAKEFLSQWNIDFVDRDITSDESALADLEKLGYMTPPVVWEGEAGTATQLLVCTAAFSRT